MTSMASENLDIKEPESEQNAATQSVVTEITSATTDAVIEIVPVIDPTLETESEANVPDSNTSTQPRAVVTEANDSNTTGKTGNVQKNTQQKISKSQRKTHVCMAAGCEQSFMRKADLVSHAQNHSRKVHKCDQCKYSATDIRYLKQHQRKHSNNL